MLGNYIPDRTGSTPRKPTGKRGQQAQKDKLRVAENFIADELECRKASMLPTNDEDDLGYIRSATKAFSAVRGAIGEGK